jgi:hypothetical protein
MFNPLLSMKLQKFYKKSMSQFTVKGRLKLNAIEWESHIDTSFPNIFLYLTSGLLKFTTQTDENSLDPPGKYVQGFKNTNFTTVEMVIFYMYLIGVPEVTVIKLIKQLFLKSDWKFGCICKAQLYFGYQYILTQEKSQLGPEEHRPPVKNNPKKFGVSCKHLHVSCIYFYNNMDKIIKGLIPHILKKYGIKHVGGSEQVLKKIGSKGIKKAYMQCIESLYKIDGSLVGMFNASTVKDSDQIIKKINDKKENDKNNKINTDTKITTVKPLPRKNNINNNENIEMNTDIATESTRIDNRNILLSNILNI